MHTSYGRYRWLRLPFGITSAPEEFQRRLRAALDGLEGVICIADNILVFDEGENQQQAEEDHDRRLIALMERCNHKNIKLNPDKLQFKLKEVKFMGNIITSAGIKADPGKIAAITQMPTPRNKAAILRFIGMVNYLSPFCEHLSSIIKPLRNLTQNGVQFNWSETQENAFKNAKEVIAKAPTLAYYDLHKPVVIQADASDEGLGGALLPDEHGRLQPVAFMSYSMSPTEQRYSQIEKECLAICHSFNKLNQWVYGKQDIEVHTDHQPLETIVRKPLNKAPVRLQKMLMRLQRYSFKALYKKGTSLHLADTLSHAALPDPVGAKVTGFEIFRIDLAHQDEEHNERLSRETEGKLQETIKSDPTLAQLRTTIVHGWPEKRQQVTRDLQHYWNYRDELTVVNGIIYKGHQVLIPQSMQADMLAKIHVNHLGAESNIRMAREVLFWPGMRKSIQNMCDTCGICAQYGRTSTKEPMKSLPIPSLPWEIISQDLFTLEQHSFLITICHFSDWIEVGELPDTLSTTIVNKTKAHFSHFGIPHICHTDNGTHLTARYTMSLQQSTDSHTQHPHHTTAKKWSGGSCSQAC